VGCLLLVLVLKVGNWDCREWKGWTYGFWFYSCGVESVHEFVLLGRNGMDGAYGHTDFNDRGFFNFNVSVHSLNSHSDFVRQSHDI
jgi:hypothetical protein